MIYTIYNPGTGEIEYTLSVSTSELADLQLANKSYVVGAYASSDYYVSDLGEVVTKPPKPTAPNCTYIFDFANKAWTLNLNKSLFDIRNIRNQLLAAVDRVNPIWYASLTADQQTELAQYRQALLSVPQQANFPADVVWPAKPTWL